jgi:phenylacetate-coenzyme A ligase PaaK-like adenylate-forming protein
MINIPWRVSMLQQPLVKDQEQKIKQLTDIIRYAKENSLVYQKKYKQYQISDNILNSFTDLPLLTRDEYYHGMKPPTFSLLAERLENSYIFTSGGTTGDVKLTVWSEEFTKNWVEECYRSLITVGLESSDVVLNLFFPGIWATHHLINKALEKANCQILPLGGKVSLDILADYLIEFKVTVLIGVPSFIIRLTEYIGTLEEDKRNKIKIKKIYHAGEFLSQNQEKFILNQLDCEINPFIYSSTDTGTIGLKCPYCKTNQYHIASTIFLELIDDNFNLVYSDDKPGEIIVSSLVNKKAPCIRYRVGDRGILNNYSCKCGNPAPLFTLIGRADDEVKIAGYLIDPALIQNELGKYKDLSKNFQLIVEENENKVDLTVKCETISNIAQEDILHLSTTISKGIVDSYDILGVLVSQEYCREPIVQIVPPGSISRNPRTGKIKLVRDMR